MDPSLAILANRHARFEPAIPRNQPQACSQPPAQRPERASPVHPRSLQRGVASSTVLLPFRQECNKTLMARLLPRIDQLAFADLVDKCHDADFAAEFPANGTLLQQQRAGRPYWYYRGYAPALDGGPPTRSLKYVGPAGDPDIERRVAAFGAQDCPLPCPSTARSSPRWPRPACFAYAPSSSARPPTRATAVSSA